MYAAAIRRRTVFGLLGGAAAWPYAVRAETVRKLGVLLYSSPAADANFRSLRRGLADLGYGEGRDLVLEVRGAEGKPERLAGLAAEVLRLRPDAVFALGGDVTAPAAKTIRTIPLIFATSADPVKLGIVASLARPGGNATGVTFLSDTLAAKRLEILKEAVPNLARAAFLWNPDHLDNELEEAARTATALAIDLRQLPLHAPDDLDGALRAAAEQKVEALYVVSSRLTSRIMDRVVDFATKNRLPLIGGWGAWAQTGALLSYGPNLDDMVRRAAAYVDKIFKGTKPADLPVQQPTRFDLTINLKTAKAFGLAIPQSLLVGADDLIE